MPKSFLESLGNASLNVLEYSLRKTTDLDESTMYVVTGATRTSMDSFVFSFTKENEFKKANPDLTENLYSKGTTSMDDIIDWLNTYYQ